MPKRIPKHNIEITTFSKILGTFILDRNNVWKEFRGYVRDGIKKGLYAYLKKENLLDVFYMNIIEDMLEAWDEEGLDGVTEWIKEKGSHHYKIKTNRYLILKLYYLLEEFHYEGTTEFGTTCD